MARWRDFGIPIGRFPVGEFNAITDVPGVLVGHSSVIQDSPRVARTGVTLVVPRNGQIWENYAFAGSHSFNGNGEMTGLLWLEESGMLGSPIGLTNTHQVGLVRDVLVRCSEELGYMDGFLLPVVAETYDGWLSDIAAFHLQEAHVRQALTNAAGGAVAEGNVGGGTGMICHEFKGGIGTSSRIVTQDGQDYHLGVLVQANYGARAHLRGNGLPIGQEIPYTLVPTPWEKPRLASSIIVIIATDAPLLPTQCRRLAQRATVGLARVGGTGYNGSGDIFLAFATGNELPRHSNGLYSLKMLPHEKMDVFFDATADATEEAILNALCAAQTMTGWQGRTAHALPHDQLQALLARYASLTKPA